MNALRDELATASAENEQLREQLRALTAARETPSSRTQSPDRLASVLEMLAQHLAASQAAPATPIVTAASAKSAKIPDPDTLTNGEDPTFESWKLQVLDKLEVNADQFPTTRSRMAYVFNRTGGDAQKHLLPRYTEGAANRFASEEEMISHLTSVYEDRFKVQNARLEYKGLMMKVSETFSAFQTRFLHLAGQAQIPTEDQMPDMFDKLTLDLQRAALPFYTSAGTLQELSNHCIALDQGLRRIKARSERLKSRNPPAVALQARNQSATTRNAPATTRNASTTPARGQTPAREQPPTPARTGTPDRVRPTYDDPRKQALSMRGACFKCRHEGHIARECPTKDETVVVQEVDETEESGKEEP